MPDEIALAETVRTWARKVMDNDGLADRAVTVALSAYAGGASVGEASEEARRFLSSWVSHPAHGAAIRHMRERLAS